MNPFSRSPQWPETYHDVLNHYHDQYDADIRAGKFQAFTYPWGLYGALVVILYLLVPHQHSPMLRRARFLAFAWIAAFAAYSIIYTRAKGMAPAFGLGLISAWSVLWIGTIIVCNDAQTDFQRIERLGGVFGSSVKGRENGSAEGAQNGSTTANDSANKHLGPARRHGPFAWQPYPLEPFIERLDWVSDIFCNFRGAGWNWRISGIPPPPKKIQEEVRENSKSLPPQPKNEPRQFMVTVYPTRSELIRESMKTLIKGYILLDLFKTVVVHDPYFWGIMDRPPPSYFPAFLRTYPAVTKIYRLMLSLLMIQWALKTIFALAPVFFSGIIGPSRIGARAEPWIYPETWGSYDVVLERGIAGWWSGWWHQTFRFAFSEPSRKIIEVARMNPKSPLAKLIQLVVAFGLSGYLHACGSYTQPGPTRPILGPLRFFLLQAAAIWAETAVTKAIKDTKVYKNSPAIPRWVKYSWTFVYVHIWFYFTSPLLVDDFANGGIWLFEPLPLSLFRGLGFGIKGDGWWQWDMSVVWWHKGSSWWTTGIAM